MRIKVSTGRYDELRRTALQLAVQLPESVEEARTVLDELAELLEHYMVHGPRPAWQLRRPPLGDPGIATPAAMFWSCAILLASAPLATAAVYLTGLPVAAALVFFAGIGAVSLVFGSCYGVGMALAAALAHNLLVVQPALILSWPSPIELAFMVGYLITALALPWFAANAAALRALAVTACARPRPAASAPSSPG